MYDKSHIISVFKEILRYEANVYKRKAYEHTIKILNAFTGEIAGTDFTTYDGIGDKINLKIWEIHGTGTCDTLEDYKKTGTKLIPDEEYFALEELMKLDGIGIVKAKALYADGYRSLADIEAAITSGKLPADVWTPKLKAVRMRIPYAQAKTIADDVIAEILKSGYNKRYMICGSLRRKKETIKDIDIVLECNSDDEILAIQTLAKQLGTIIQSGSQSVRFNYQDINIDLRLSPSKYFGSMINYYTGSAEHNIKLRADAKRRGWLINERGVFLAGSEIRIARVLGAKSVLIFIDDDKYSYDNVTWIPIVDEVFIDGHYEKDLFDILEIPWVEPENRI